MIRAWHFTGDKLRDGRPIPKVGEWLVHDGPIVICKSGLHASRDPFDALKYAPGTMLHLVECDEIEDEEDDKLVCRRRRIIASKDATEGLRYLARMQALSVVHLWDAQDVTLDFLMTGDESLRAAARAAARAAWEAAARDAALEVARAALAALAAAWAAEEAWEAQAALAARDAAWAAAQAAARAEWNLLVNEAFEEYL